MADIKAVGQITIVLLEDGQVHCNFHVPDSLVGFTMLGAATSSLANEQRKKSAQSIQVVPYTAIPPQNGNHPGVA